ncbi:hypothetical protein [Brucella pseudogrignonensis]|uniref:hypothetical protein n=1 Tax=Brucella pseudogrignonensis TaxID=419475 RepID=UPI000CFAC20C|nr:hypothetical protein [Brucella pseudogrignonensis]MQP38736.1 hypothetical protein [Ochrobactrum sp. MYb237]PQZ43350.1 hypothetical protein CQ059_05310 [Brucella pseudogrignonensis]PRA43097.1 hypothetical protein CQ063_01795 [Brucella pseudogrignonensis]PRA72433.1 hypothetical protein CQ055_03785 [Brucella pseudogrignonensis]
MRTLGVTIYLLLLVAILAAIGGWIANLFKVFGLLVAQGVDLTGELVVRVIGIVIPIIGAIAGYL